MPRRPWVIAHRGASGYVLEHSIAAKVLAHQQGADFLEQDVIASRDRQLLVCHDLYLDRVTDVASRFPGRARDDGRHYAIDFDWEEIRELRLRAAAQGDPHGVLRSLGVEAERWDRLCRLDEELELVHRLNAHYGRDVGIYLELKHPRWHAEQGCDLAAAVVQMIEAHGFAGSRGHGYLQCFDAATLRRIKTELRCSLPLVQLVGRSVDASRLTPEGLEETATYAAALGPNYRQLLVSRGAAGARVADLVGDARRAGLALHPYTFNRDAIPARFDGLEELLGWFYRNIAPDAVFCDFPDIAVQARERLAGGARVR